MSSTEKYGGHALTVHMNYKAMAALYAKGSSRSTATVLLLSFLLISVSLYLLS